MGDANYDGIINGLDLDLLKANIGLPPLSGGSATAGNVPEPGTLLLLVIDLLDTFYDQSVPLFERRRLLAGCVERLRLVSQGTEIATATLVIASLRPPRPPQTDPTGLLQTVQAAADQVWFQEEDLPSLPPRLF